MTPLCCIEGQGGCLKHRGLTVGLLLIPQNGEKYHDPLWSGCDSGYYAVQRPVR